MFVDRKTQHFPHPSFYSLIDCGPLADFNLSCFAQMSVYIILICKFDKDPNLVEKLRDVFLPDSLDLTPQGFVMLLAHGPTDISDHFLLDSILTGTFRNRFGLICACHQCEDTPTLKSYCCDNSVKCIENTLMIIKSNTNEKGRIYPEYLPVFVLTN